MIALIVSCPLCKKKTNSSCTVLYISFLSLMFTQTSPHSSTIHVTLLSLGPQRDPQSVLCRYPRPRYNTTKTSHTTDWKLRGRAAVRRFFYSHPMHQHYANWSVEWRGTVIGSVIGPTEYWGQHHVQKTPTIADRHVQRAWTKPGPWGP